MREEKRCACCGGLVAGTRQEIETSFELDDLDDLDDLDGWNDCRCGAPMLGGAGASERKLAAILARLKTLWNWQAQRSRASRLDGATIFSEAEWAALGDSMLFARLREGSDEEGGGGAPSQAPPPFTWPGDERDGQPGASERGRR
jgi:hypothetical protein